MTTNGRYHKSVRITNIQTSPQLTEDIVRWVHKADIGNIFDLSIFRQPLRNMATANLTLWNRARHDELIEALNRQPYRDTLLHCLGSHEVDHIDRPTTTNVRVPMPADAYNEAHTYAEPQTGPFEACIAEWTRRRVPRQKSTVETKTVVTTRTFVEPLTVTLTKDCRAPVQRRLGTQRFDPLKSPHRKEPVSTAPVEDGPRQEHVPPADDETSE
jgi:hypothetical protein